MADIDWEGADLRGANLRNCTFHLGSSRSGLVNSPIACEGSRTGFYGDEFDEQTYRSPEEIRKANLCGADLREADVGGTDFYLVWRLTRRCCELLLERGFELHVLTKSALVLRDLDVFAGRPVQLGVTLTTLDEELRELWEPGAASIEERLRVIETARRAGHKTSVMFGPLLPFLSDNQASIDALLDRAADLGIDRIWVDAINPRPRVWPAVAELLRAKFPKLLQPCRKILFDPPSRAMYLKELRNRIDDGARRKSLTDRVAACM